MKKCPPGEYYCNQDKKCKPIPSGYHTARGGFLVRDNYTKKNGNGNGGGVSEAIRLAPKTGNIISVNLAWRGNDYNLKMFFPHVKTPSRREVQDQVRKVYPNAKLWNYKVSDYDPGEPLLIGGEKN